MNQKELVAYLQEKEFNESTVKAFGVVPREAFVPEQFREYAYEDIAIPLDEGQAISQPSALAFIIDLLELKKDQKILEIGSGSGYVLALISAIVQKGELYGLEIDAELAVKSKKQLSSDSNIHIINKNGWSGFIEQEPFDRILVSATCPTMDKVYSFVEQLKEGGVLVAPYKNMVLQLRKIRQRIEKREFSSFSFVPLVKDDYG